MIFPGGVVCSRVSLKPPAPEVSSAGSLATGKATHWDRPGRCGKPFVLHACERPASFVNQPVMRSAQQCEIGKRRFTASRPPHEVMPIAPEQGPSAAGTDTTAVACLERTPRRRRKGAGAG